MVATITRTDLPEWARNNMMIICPHGGCYIVDNSDTGVTTARRCINKKCPGHMSYKISALADYFKIKGIGEKTAAELIRDYKLESHLQVVGLWFQTVKPLLSFADYVSIAYLEGYGTTTAQSDLGCYGSPEQYFSECANPDPILLDNKDFLLENAKYFRFKPGLSKLKLNCMATGSFHGYENRDDYFTAINNVYGQYVQVVQVGARKSNVHFLIREADAVDHRKTAIAKENGIPIVTPLQFLAMLNQQFPEALNLEERKKEEANVGVVTGVSPVS